MRGLEGRLRRLERGGGCPECAEARASLLESIVEPEPKDAPTRCEGCGRDVRLSLVEVDALLEGEGEG